MAKRRTYQEIAVGLGNQFLDTYSPEAIASLSPRDKRTFYAGKTDTNIQTSVHAAIAPYLSDPLAKAALATAGAGGGLTRSIPPPKTIKHNVQLRGPGTDWVTLTANSRIYKPFLQPRTIILDGVESAMSNIDQANDVVNMVNGIIADLKKQEEKQVEDYEAALSADAASKKGVADEDIAEATTEQEEDVATEFGLAKEKFGRESVPLIQQSLNARGLFESGATPEALARAMKESASATTAEQMDAAMKDLQARYAPGIAYGNLMRGNDLTQATQMNAFRISQMLQELSSDAQLPAQPDILAQMLGAGAGAGATAWLTRRRRPRPRPPLDFDIEGGGYGTNLDLYRTGGGALPY